MDGSHYAFDAELADWHWWYVGRRHILSHLLHTLIVPDQKRKILEVGCSTGSNLSMLAEFGNVHGIEMSEAALNLAQQRYPDFHLCQGAIPSCLPEQYDLICLFDVLEHIEDDHGAIDWIADYLCSNGRIALSVPAFPVLWSSHDELAHHKRRYVKSDLLALFRNRFVIDTCCYFNSHLFPAILSARLIQRLFRSDGKRDKRAGGVPLLNNLLSKIFMSETFWLPQHAWPFGVSLFVSGIVKS